MKKVYVLLEYYLKKKKKNYICITGVPERKENRKQ